MKKTLFLALFLALACRLKADTVTLNDGSTLKGTVRTLPGGDIEVTTTGGILHIARNQVETIEFDPAQPQTQTQAQPQVQPAQVQAQPAAAATASPTADRKNPLIRQVIFQIGENFYAGDLLDPAGVFRFSDFDGLNFGVSGGKMFSDNIGWEGWLNFQSASKAKALKDGSISTMDLFKLDFGISPKAQLLFPQQGDRRFIIPSIGIGPVLTLMSATPRTAAAASPQNPASASGIGIGAAFHVGTDWQFGNVLVGGRLRYILSYDLGNQFGSKNLGGILLQLGMGWAW